MGNSSGIDPAAPHDGAAAAREADREKRAVALTSVGAAVVLTGTKLVVGLSTQSLGILSEALHSGLDLLAALLTFFAVRVSGRPADPEHHYGHGKIENLSALSQTVLLFATCAWIGVEAFERFFRKSVEVDANHWAFLVVLLSLAIDWSRSRALLRVARRHGSPALEADALHFSTDLWSSGVVLVGLVLVRVAAAARAPWLAHADAVAGLIVAVIVIRVGWELARRNIDALLDRASPGLRERVAHAVLLPGVREVQQLRLRGSGAAAFVDLTLGVDRGTSLERAHDIAQAAEDAVRGLLPQADVVVHIEPVLGQSEGILDLVRLHASREGFTAHDVLVHDVGGRHSIDLHLEAAETLSLAEADRRARSFEEAVRTAVPRLENLGVHLEPAGEGAGRPTAAPPATVDRVRAALRLVSTEVGSPFEAHALRVHATNGRLSASFHCVLRHHTSLEEAHRLSEEIERRLRLRVPGFERITIRVEPPGAACPEEGPGRATPLPPTRDLPM